MSSHSKDINQLIESIHYKHHTLSYLLWIAYRVIIKTLSCTCTFLSGILKKLELYLDWSSLLYAAQPVTWTGPCQGFALYLQGFDCRAVLVHGVSHALYTILLCPALQEITNILKCLASVVHIGNNSTIKQQHLWKTHSLFIVVRF